MTVPFRSLLPLALLAGFMPAFAADAVSYVTTRISVGGEVEHPLSLGVDDLRAFPPQQIAEVQLQRRSGADAGTLRRLRGVRLADILDRATIRAPGHNDVKKLVVIAGASDGYKVVFSWSEIFNSPLGEGVIVYFEQDGAPLADDEGRIAMVSSKDIRTGPRHVKWLQSIEVRKVVE